MALTPTATSDVELDQEISQLWTQVEMRVIQMAGSDESVLQKDLDIEGVIASLNQTQSNNKKEAEKYAQAKTVLSRTLQCIQTIGAMVCAPASLCYNALTLVIQAWQAHDGVDDGLTSLLEKCIEFMDRLSIYTRAGMDSKLTMVACLHLHLFVEICDRCLKLRQRPFVRQLLLNDAGVQDLLGTMSGLIDEERGLVAAQTWKSSIEAAESSRDNLLLTRQMHASLLENKDQQSREKNIELWKHTIAATLSFDHDILGDNSKRPWDDIWNRQKAGILPGTGEWLFKNTKFTSWLQGATQTSRFLGLQGERGSGKTLLASNAILNIQRGNLKALGLSGSQPIVVHNFMDTDPRVMTQDNKSHTAKLMSRNMICQLALADGSLMESIANICHSSKGLENPVDIWSQLVCENDDLAMMDVTLFIIFDGILGNPQTFIPILQGLATCPMSDRIRVLITGSAELFHELETVSGLSMIKVALAGFTEPDMELYIKNRMDDMEILKESKRRSVADIRTNILNVLPASTKGDYYKINRVLDNISITDDPDEIELEVEFSGHARPEQIQADIQTLNRTLSSKEIAEINELILWVSNAADYDVNLNMMEGAIELGLGSSASRSLMSIKSKIKSKYTLFQVGWNDRVEYKLYEIQNIIPFKVRARESARMNEETEVSATEIKILKHYLSTVCPEDLYEKVGFEEFFKSKLTRKGVQIHQDPDNAHIQLALRCIRCLVEERNEKTERLYKYSQKHLLRHLNATDLSLADRELKAEAGVMLVRLFSEEYAIGSLLGLEDIAPNLAYESYFWDQFFPSPWQTWVFNQEWITSISRWFEDSAVIEDVKDNPLIGALNNQKTDFQMVLLKTGMIRVANDLFRRDTTTNEIQLAFAFLYSLITKKKLPFTDGNITPTYESFQVVESWSQKALGYSEKDALWEALAVDALQRLKLDTSTEIQEECYRRAMRALELDPYCWQASYALSRLEYSDEEQAHVLEGIVDNLFEDDDWISRPRNKMILTMLLLELANKLDFRDERHEKVNLRILEIDRSPEILGHISSTLGDYSDRENWDAIIKFYEHLLEEPEKNVNTAGTFFAHHIGTYPLAESTLQAIKATGRVDLVETLFAKAYATELEAKDLNTLRYEHGRMLIQIDGFEEAGLAIWEEYRQGTSEGDVGMKDLGYHLINVWVKLAYREGTPPADAETYHRKIQAYYDDHRDDINRDLNCCACMAQYFRRQGEERKAKQLLEELVSEALEMLSDTELESYVGPLTTISTACCAMNDLRNSFVAWELGQLAGRAETAEKKRRNSIWNRKQMAEIQGKGKIGPDHNHEGDERQKTLEIDEENASRRGDDTGGRRQLESDSDPAMQSTNEPDSDGDTWWDMGKRLADDEITPDSLFIYGLTYCHLCRLVRQDASGMWLCLTHAGIKIYDDECYKKLVEGNAPAANCSKDDEFVRIPPRDNERAKSIPRGCVVVQDEVVEYEAWKTEIRAKYVEG